MIGYITLFAVLFIWSGSGRKIDEGSFGVILSLLPWIGLWWLGSINFDEDEKQGLEWYMAIFSELLLGFDIAAVWIEDFIDESVKVVQEQ